MNEKDPQVIYADFISSQRLKMTPQRRQILEVFLKAKGHMSSEELYHRVKKSFAGIGQATVYRTLKLLAGAGLAKEVDFGDGVTRWEQSHGHAHHDHLICQHCGKNVEVVDEAIEKLQEVVAARHGFNLTGHKMYLYGICPDCRGEQAACSKTGK